MPRLSREEREKRKRDAEIAAMSMGMKVITFIETYCKIPEGDKVGEPMVLMPFQKKFILDVYDNPHGTKRAYLSIARKNGKSTLIAALALAHLIGPVSKKNSQIISGARSRDQASIVFKLAEKMIRLDQTLSAIIKIITSTKTLVGYTRGTEYRAISAEAGTAHGLSPAVAILDEVGQVKGPADPFVEALETAQGAYEDSLLLAISTQAPTDADLLSMWLDDAAQSRDPTIVSHLYTAPADCALDDRSAWESANPGMGTFRSLKDVEDFSKRAVRQPSVEQTFRWLYLNQRVEATSPFVSRSLWNGLKGQVVQSFERLPIYAGLDLAETADLTALVMMANVEGRWHLKPTFWLPGVDLRNRSQKDRVPYDAWKKQGYLATTPGRSVEYEFVAEYLRGLFDTLDMRQVAFDRWGWKHLRPWLVHVGFSDSELERFVEFGQGYESMSPALRTLESLMLNDKVRHGGNPVMDMCAANAVVQSDAAGNRKLTKQKSHGRIDGMVALAMAVGVAGSYLPEEQPSYQILVI